MREILFRAKRIDNGEWVEGYYIRQDETTYCFKEDCERHPENTKHYIVFDMPTDWGLPNRHLMAEIDHETICQYTGLKDKNGKRIWENDILQNARNNDLYTVKWHGSFGMYVWSKRKENNKHIFDYGDLYLMNRKCVVIGNIFDNPELLKGE